LSIEVTYDDYTVATAENRLLRTALRWMAAVPQLPDSTHARLSHLDGRLDGVRLLPGGAILPDWRPSRLNAQYLPALRLAELVLRRYSADPGAGWPAHGRVRCERGDGLRGLRHDGSGRGVAESSGTTLVTA